MNNRTYPLWSDADQKALLASRDLITSELIFPVVPDESPLKHRYERVAIETVGTLYSFTVVHHNPKSGLGPTALGFVDFPGPMRIFGRLLVGEEPPLIGQRLQIVPHADCGYAFMPIQD